MKPSEESMKAIQSSCSRGGMLVLGLVLAAAEPALAQQAPAGPGDYLYSTDWTSRNTQVWLKHLAQFAGRPGVRGLEVGCFEGRSSIWFLEHVANHPVS